MTERERRIERERERLTAFRSLVLSSQMKSKLYSRDLILVKRNDVGNVLSSDEQFEWESVLCVCLSMFALSLLIRILFFSEKMSTTTAEAKRRNAKIRTRTRTSLLVPSANMCSQQRQQTTMAKIDVSSRRKQVASFSLDMDISIQLDLPTWSMSISFVERMRVTVFLSLCVVHRLENE